MTVREATPDRTRTMRVPRTRGAVSGLLLVVLGAWGALVPFIGPYFDYSYYSDQTWVWTAARFWLEVLPGAATALGGLLVLVSKNRLSGSVGGWLAAAGGAWFVVGLSLDSLWHLGDIGAPLSTRDSGRTLAQLGYFYGLGAVILFLAAFALGRLAVVGVRDLRAAQRDDERAAELERQAELDRRTELERQAEADRQAETERQVETDRQVEADRRAAAERDAGAGVAGREVRSDRTMADRTVDDHDHDHDHRPDRTEARAEAADTDTGRTDTGRTDTGRTDTGRTDAGRTDTGRTDEADQARTDFERRDPSYDPNDGRSGGQSGAHSTDGQPPASDVRSSPYDQQG
ncbi:MAG: hypothetical protein ACR2N4_07395 [Jatrophihabitans sp.]